MKTNKMKCLVLHRLCSEGLWNTSWKYIKLSLRRTPPGQHQLSVLERCPAYRELRCSKMTEKGCTRTRLFAHLYIEVSLYTQPTWIWAAAVPLHSEIYLKDFFLEHRRKHSAFLEYHMSRTHEALYDHYFLMVYYMGGGLGTPIHGLNRYMLRDSLWFLRVSSGNVSLVWSELYPSLKPDLKLRES